MGIRFLDPRHIRRFCEGISSDPEFKLAAKFMSQNILLGVGDSKCIVSIRDGIVAEFNLSPTFMDSWDFSIRATTESWEKLLSPLPPAFYHGLFAGMHRGTFSLDGNLEAAFAHFWAVNRMLDVMRQLQNG
ncbi:MAG: hypothetical protein ABSB22_05440 [Thermodesulfobacteriota bacterium]